MVENKNNKTEKKNLKNSLELLLTKDRYDREMDFQAQKVELGWIWKYRYLIAFVAVFFVCFLIAILF